MEDHNGGAGGRTMVSVRLSRAEQDTLRSAAERRGESVSSFVRRVSLAEAGAGWRDLLAVTADTTTVTMGAVLQETESGKLVASRLMNTPAVNAQFGASLSSGDFSQRALHGVREFTSRYEDDDTEGPTA